VRKEAIDCTSMAITVIPLIVAMERQVSPWVKLTVVLAVLATGNLAAGTYRQTSGRPGSLRERVVAYMPGVTLASRIQPDDEILVVERFQEIDFIEAQPPLTVSQILKGETDKADTVVVIAVDKIEGALTSDQSWVETRVRGTIRDVLKSRSAQRAAGESLTMMYPHGGEITIGRCRVKAGIPFKVAAGRQYLLFLKLDENKQLSADSALGIEGGKLVNPWELEPSSKLKSPLHGQSLDAVARELRAIERAR
jgi:hypothetical protein